LTIKLFARLPYAVLGWPAARQMFSPLQRNATSHYFRLACGQPDALNLFGVNATLCCFGWMEVSQMQ